VCDVRPPVLDVGAISSGHRHDEFVGCEVLVNNALEARFLVFDTETDHVLREVSHVRRLIFRVQWGIDVWREITLIDYKKLPRVALIACDQKTLGETD
jgi:hypothetical protein